MTEEPLYIKITPEPNEDEREVILKAFKNCGRKTKRHLFHTNGDSVEDGGLINLTHGLCTVRGEIRTRKQTVTSQSN